MQRSATVQTRGRVTLPLGLRQVLNVAPGDDVVFNQTAPGCFEVRAEARKAALLNRPRVSRLEVPVRRQAPKMELPSPGARQASR